MNFSDTNVPLGAGAGKGAVGLVRGRGEAGARQVDIVVRHMNQDPWVGRYVQRGLTPTRFLGWKTTSGAAATGQI